MSRRDDLTALARRVVSRGWRELNPDSTICQSWVRRGEHITFKSNGFVAAPDIPMLFARHHYETRAIRAVLAGLEIRRLLEIGCGFGRLSPTFAALAEQHLAVDINADALATAQAAYPDLAFAQVDGCRLPFPDDSFDLVVTWTVLQHIPPERIGNALAEMRRVVSRSGAVLLCEETRRPGAPTRHCWHRTTEFYRKAFAPMRLAHCGYIHEIDRMPGLTSPGRVMLLVSTQL